MVVYEIPSSGTPAHTFPEADGPREYGAALAVDHPTQGGNLSNWNLGYRYAATLYAEGNTLITSADVAIWADWWRRQALLSITFEESTYPVSVYIKVVNPSAPFSRRVHATDLWMGLVHIEGTDGHGPQTGFPFILDDAVLGQLDVNNLG